MKDCGVPEIALASTKFSFYPFPVFPSAPLLQIQMLPQHHPAEQEKHHNHHHIVDNGKCQPPYSQGSGLQDGIGNAGGHRGEHALHQGPASRSAPPQTPAAWKKAAPGKYRQRSQHEAKGDNTSRMPVSTKYTVGVFSNASRRLENRTLRAIAGRSVPSMAVQPMRIR